MDVKLLLVNKIPPFSGAPGQSWEQWITRFETQATGVNDDDRLHCLLMLLSGAALDLFANQSVKIDYDGAKKSLSSRFGTAIGHIQAQAELVRASQEPGESVDDFADRLRRWGRLAYPATASGDTTVEITLVGRFLAGLASGWLQEKLCQASPKNLKGAVEEARRLQCQQQAIESLRRPDAAKVALPAVNVPSSPMETRLTALEGCIQSMQQDLQHALSALSAQGAPSSRNQAQRQSREPGATGGGSPLHKRCFACNQEGHFKRACPNRDAAGQEVKGTSLRTHQGPPPFCVGCGAPGHWMVDCQRLRSEGATTRTPGFPARGQRNPGNY